jgi:hypothetical protein
MFASITSSRRIEKREAFRRRRGGPTGRIAWNPQIGVKEPKVPAAPRGLVRGLMSQLREPPALCATPWCVARAAAPTGMPASARGC